MKIQLWSVGKAHEPYIKDGINIFTKRITHYFPVEWHVISIDKSAASLSGEEFKKAESEIILRSLVPEHFVVLLDEKGKQMSSPQLASFIQQKANSSTKNLIFLIGGSFGVDDIILKRANCIWSLSQLVFPHQLVRLILVEQVYRACTIIRNEKYHHS